MQILGGMFLALQVIPYEFLLACKNTRINNLLGISNVVLSLTLTPWMIRSAGLRGAGLSYMYIMLSSTIVLQLITYQKYVKKSMMLWYFKAILLPTVTCFGAAFVSRKFLLIFHSGKLITLIAAILFGSVTLLLEMYIFNKKMVRLVLSNFYRKRFLPK
jgi:hypothetical protein